VIKAHPQATTPRVDEDFIVDKIVTTNSVRLKKEAIKTGVKEYIRSRTKKDSQTTNSVEADKPRKRVKKEELEFEFADNEGYKFEQLGGVQEAVDEIKKVVFLPIERKD
jgi:hypothetical protein